MPSSVNGFGSYFRGFTGSSTGFSAAYLQISDACLCLTPAVPAHVITRSHNSASQSVPCSAFWWLWPWSRSSPPWGDACPMSLLAFHSFSFLRPHRSQRAVLGLLCFLPYRTLSASGECMVCVLFLELMLRGKQILASLLPHSSFVLFCFFNS